MLTRYTSTSPDTHTTYRSKGRHLLLTHTLRQNPRLFQLPRRPTRRQEDLAVLDRSPIAQGQGLRLDVHVGDGRLDEDDGGGSVDGGVGCDCRWENLVGGRWLVEEAGCAERWDERSEA